MVSQKHVVLLLVKEPFMEYPLLQLQTEFDNVAVATARVDPQLLFEIQIKVNLISKAASANPV